MPHTLSKAFEEIVEEITKTYDGLLETLNRIGTTDLGLIGSRAKLTDFKINVLFAFENRDSQTSLVQAVLNDLKENYRRLFDLYFDEIASPKPKMKCLHVEEFKFKLNMSLSNMCNSMMKLFNAFKSNLGPAVGVDIATIIISCQLKLNVKDRANFFKTFVPIYENFIKLNGQEYQYKWFKRTLKTQFSEFSENFYI